MSRPWCVCFRRKKMYRILQGVLRLVIHPLCYDGSKRKSLRNLSREDGKRRKLVLPDASKRVFKTVK